MDLVSKARVAGVVTATFLFAAAQSPGARVDLSLIVTDKDTKSVNTIRKEDVRVLEDNVEQTVLSVETDERPVDCVLAIDGSGSFRRLLPSALSAAQTIVMQKRSPDEIYIERFVGADKIEKFHDFTTDANSLAQSLRSFFIEGGRSVVIDALYAAVERVADHHKSSDERRKVVVMITDGEDRASVHKLDSLLQLLRKTQVQVFVLGLTSDLDSEILATRMSPRDKAEKLLKTVAEESGGRAFFPQNDKELTNATAEVINNLRTQFRVTYQSSNNNATPGFRKIEVKLSSANGEKRIPIAPRGYNVK